MKILTIPEWNNHIFIHRGFKLAKYLVQVGDEVHFINWDPYPTNFETVKLNLTSSLKYKTEIKDGVTVHKVRRLPFIFPPVNGPMFKKQISQICEQNGIEVIVSSSMVNELIPPFDLPLVYDLWDNMELAVDIYETTIKKIAQKCVLKLKESIHSQMRNASAITVVSDGLLHYANKIAPDSPVYKIPNGVEESFLKASPDASTYNYDKHTMVYIADFIKWYKLPICLEAVAILKKDYPDIKLLLVGEGKTIPAAKKMTMELGLTENVQFFGQVEQDEVIRIVKKCEIGLSTLVKDARSDSCFPLKILEYTALGKKVVSSNVEEVKRLGFPNIIIYDENGGVEALVNGIKQAFNMDIDLQKMKIAISQYSWKTIASRFRDVLQEAINRR